MTESDYGHGLIKINMQPLQRRNVFDDYNKKDKEGLQQKRNVCDCSLVDFSEDCSLVGIKMCHPAYLQKYEKNTLQG